MPIFGFRQYSYITMSSPTIQDIVVKDVEKRRVPSKHYAYIIEVHWSDGTSSVIGRQYSAFFDFQMSLLESFPVEGGQRDPASRVIPFLPGKIIFRSNTRDVAVKRMVPISEYCTGIAKLPKNVSESDIVLDFFRPRPEDRRSSNKGVSVSPEKKNAGNNTANQITGPLVLDKYVAIAEYKKETKNKKELNLKEGEVVEVVEKSENGWWLATNEEGMNGWVPGVFLESLYGEQSSPKKEKRMKPGEGEMYQAITDFQAAAGELSFKANDILEILEKNLEGWWYARKDDAEGWVPGTYLEKFNYTPMMGASSTGQRGFAGAGFRQRSLEKAKRPPPKRSTVRRTLTTAAATKVQVDYKAKMLKQESLTEEDEEEFAGIYTTVGEFDSTIEDGISFGKDETVYVMQKSSAGWWYGRIRDKRGWLPETYLKERDPEPSPVAQPRPLFPAPGQTSTPLVGLNGTPTRSGSKSPKPPRPPAPKIAPKTEAAKQTAKILGGYTSPTKSYKPETRDPGSALPPKPKTKNSYGKEDDLEDYQWYRDITRQEAEDALISEGEEGYFIIRPSQRGAKQGKPYSLTLFHQNQAWNFHIRLRPDQKYAVGVYKESEPCFSALSELVDYYTEEPMLIGEEEREVRLIDSPQELYARC